MFEILKIMNLQVEKIKLAQTILGLDSEIILKHLKAVLNSYQTDLWDELPDEVKQSALRGIKQADNGEYKSHDEVMKKYKKWLKK